MAEFDPKKPITDAPVFDASKPISDAPVFDAKKPISDTPSAPAATEDQMSKKGMKESPYTRYSGGGLLGAPTSSDPAEQKRLEAREARKAEAVGAAAGIAEVPVAIGQYAASKAGANEAEEWFTNWQRELEKKGTPAGRASGRMIGEIGAYLLGGEALAGTKIASWLAGAAEAAPEMLSTGYKALRGAAPEIEAGAKEVAAEAEQTLTRGQKLWEGLKDSVADATKRGGAGAAGGAVFGASSGAMEPRTEATKAERDAKRWEEMKHEMASNAKLFAGLGMASSAIPNIALFGKGAWNEWNLAEQTQRLTEAEKVLEEQRNMLAKLTREGQAKKAEEISKMPGEKDIQAGVEAAQQKVAQAEEALNFQQQRVEAAQQTADKLADQFRTARTAKSPVEWGSVSQKELAAQEKSLEKARSDAANYEGAIKDLPKDPIINVEPVKAYIDSIYDNQIQAVKNVLDNYRRELGIETAATEKNAAKQLSEQQKRTEAGFPANGITPEKWNNLRSYSHNPENFGGIKGEPGVTAHLRQINELLEKAGGDSVESIRKANEIYRKESRPLDPYRVGGLSGGITEKDLYSGKFTMFEGEVAQKLLTAARQGNMDLAQVIKSNPSLQEATKDLMYGELFGYGNIKNEITPQSFNAFWKNNQELLEKSGLMPEFKDMQTTIANHTKAVAEAEEAVKMQTEAKAKADQILKVSESQAKEQRAALQKTEQARRYLSRRGNVIEASPIERSVTKAEGWATDLAKRGVITEAEHQQMVKGINEARAEYETSKKTLQDQEALRKRLLYWLKLGGLTVGGGVLGAETYHTAYGQRGGR